MMSSFMSSDLQCAVHKVFYLQCACKLLDIQPNLVTTTRFVQHLVYCTRHSVLSINSSLKTITLYSSVINNNCL